MLKSELEKLLIIEKRRNKDLKDALYFAVNKLNYLATGMGCKRNGKWSASYLAADTLEELVKRGLTK